MAGPPQRPALTARLFRVVLTNEPFPFTRHHISQRDLQLLLLLVDRAIELGDELGVVVGELFFERFARRMTERADERAFELADAPQAEIGDLKFRGGYLWLERNIGWQPGPIDVRGDLDIGPQPHAGIGFGRDAIDLHAVLPLRLAAEGFETGNGCDFQA